MGTSRWLVTFADGTVLTVPGESATAAWRRAEIKYKEIKKVQAPHVERVASGSYWDGKRS